MATLVIPNSFEAGTPAVASDVNENFIAIRDFVELVAEGTNIDVGVIAVNRLTSGAVNTLSPMGSVLPYAGVVEPANWKFCNGQALTIADHTALYNILTSNGTVFRYGANPSVSTFVLPNLSHRVPVGLGTEAEFNVLGEIGGSKNSVQAHIHTVSGSALSSATGVTTTGAGNHNHSGTTDSQGTHFHSIDTDELNSVVSHGHGSGSEVMAGSGSTPEGSGTATTSVTGSHQHPFTTSFQADHTHGITDPTHGHTVSGTALSTGVESGNLQPYMALNYIIRVA